MDPFPPFYPILDVAVCRARGLELLRVAESCFDGGARLLQLRVKDRSSDEFLRLADALVTIANARRAFVVVNDRADIARLARARGVHVGQDDLPVDSVRAIVGNDATVGLSTHDEDQVDAALASTATYVAVGPVFETATKDAGYGARGPGLVRYAAKRGKPIVAIGGITLERVPLVLTAGASAVAVIGDLLATRDVERRTREYVHACGGYRDL